MRSASPTPFGRFRPLVALGVFGLVWGLLAAVAPVDARTEAGFGVIGALGLLVFLALLVERGTEAALAFLFRQSETRARAEREQASDAFGDIANTVQKLAGQDPDASWGGHADAFGKAASARLEQMERCDLRTIEIRTRKVRAAVLISLSLATCLTIAGFRVLYPVSACCASGPTAWIDMGFTILVLVGLAETWHKVLTVSRD